MTKIFYDHLISLTQLDIVIKKSAQSKEEQEELWNLVEDMLHHKIMHVILDHLPRDYHFEFLEEFTKAPHDEKHLHFLKDKIRHKDIEKVIEDEMQQLEEETLRELFATQKKV